MALLTIDQNPALDDTILFNLFTFDQSDNLTNVYSVDQVIIYFVERDYVSSNLEEFDLDIQGFQTSFTYKDATPIKVFGSDLFPAWLSSDTPNAFLTKIDFDPEGNPDVGHFQLQWTPSDSLQSRQGDYFLCYTWTPIPAGDSFSKLIRFFVSGNFLTPAVPSHRTNPLKYSTLLDRYTPEMFKMFTAPGDITPQVIQKTNLAIADGFTELENLANQLIDLLDANVLQEVFLPYLANMFRWKLRSNDSTLWRRQVRNAIPLYKKKGTLGGLKEALSESGIEFKKITYYWQIVSKATWQEAFIVNSNQTIFCLSKKALLPVDSNFHVFYRAKDTKTYIEIPLNYVQFDTTTTTNTNCDNNTVYTTCVTWITNQIVLQPGDVVRIIYKIAEPTDQQLENYIQTLDLADQRDELTFTFPVKNWNVRLIAEDDLFFHLIVPVPHPFTYPVVYGKVRTEFPYSENIYNMETYNGSVRDSTDPCDLDSSFYDICSACRSSKVSIDVAIEQLSNDRIVETEEIIKDFLPFHAVLHSINYVGLQDELILPPLEEIECLIKFDFTEFIAFSQFDFDRIIRDGKSDFNVIKRDMLADSNAVASGNDGIGYNLFYTIFSPGIQFGEIGINDENNLLEILSGTNQGQYSLQDPDSATADVIGINQFPLDQSGFPFRFSNIQYEEMGASIYQDNLVTFTDLNVDFTLFPIPDGDTWVIKVTSGSNIGTYTINKILSDNTFILSNWTAGNDSGFSYQLNAPGNVNIFNGISGQVNVRKRGRLQTQLIKNEYNVKNGDYVLLSGIQYQILFIADRPISPTFDKVYIDGYNSGDQVGMANIKILRRLVDNAIGYINFRGMKLHTTINYEVSLGIQNGQNPVSTVLENSDFKENYLILIGTTYYGMADINGKDIFLNGPVLNWGTLGQTTNVNYTIIQFVKKLVTIQSGFDGIFRTFDPFVDRRGDQSVFVIEQDLMMTAPMKFQMQMLNKLNQGEIIEEIVKTKESISYQVIRKED